MRHALIRAIMLVTVLMAASACTLPGLSGTAPAPGTPGAPATSAASELAPYYKAMRPGFEKDIDAHADDHHYWLDLEVTLNPVRVSGHQRVKFANHYDTALDQIVFRLVPNGLSGGQLETVSHVTVDGKPARTALSVGNSVLTVTPDNKVSAGQSVEVAMDFLLQLPAGQELSYGRIEDKGDLIALASFFPMLSVYEHGDWWKAPFVDLGDPAYSEIALFDMSLTVPKELKVAASGVTVNHTAGNGDTLQYQMASGPIRDFAIILSPDFELASQTQDGVTVNIWSAPGDTDTDKYALDKTLKALKLYDEQFGKYPFSEFDVVETPIRASGIEYPGLIYMAYTIWDSKNGNRMEFVLAHEIAHQWWYSMVGNDQINEPWVDEALADYSSIVYFREGYGTASGDRLRSFFQQSVDEYLSRYNTRMPTGLPASAYTSEQYGTFVYDEGALVYSHLEDDYGKDKVVAMLRAYYQQYRYGIAHIDDLRRLVKEFFGDKGQQFFDDWVKGA